MESASNSDQLEMLRRMMRIRRFEARAEELHAAGEIPGALHTATGQEGEIVGACMAIRPDDYMVGNHRSHGHPIAKGASLNGLMAELFGKATGVCRGKGGSMHLSDFSVGSLGETSIVGSGVPVAVGAALGAQMQGSDRIALCFFGDGAANEGAFHEGMNLASIWKLPVIFLCENNLYAVSTRVDYAMAVDNVADRAAAYGMPGEIVDGQDANAVKAVVREAADRARAGSGPTLVEAKTYLFAEHAVNMGRKLAQKPEDEERAWRERDPILLFAKQLRAFGISDDEIETIEKEVSDEVEEAILFARRSDAPDPADAYSDVFVEPVARMRF